MENNINSRNREERSFTKLFVRTIQADFGKTLNNSIHAYYTVQDNKSVPMFQKNVQLPALDYLKYVQMASEC